MPFDPIRDASDQITPPHAPETGSFSPTQKSPTQRPSTSEGIPQQSRSESIEAQDDGKPVKRQRVSRACDLCRRKKMRCDASQDILNGENGIRKDPCFEMPAEDACKNCKNAGQPCTFTKNYVKAEPRRVYIQLLEQKISNLENTLQATTSPSNEPTPLQPPPEYLGGDKPHPDLTQIGGKRTHGSIDADYDPRYGRPISQQPPGRPQDRPYTAEARMQDSRFQFGGMSARNSVSYTDPPSPPPTAMSDSTNFMSSGQSRKASIYDRRSSQDITLPPISELHDQFAYRIPRVARNSAPELSPNPQLGGEFPAGPPFHPVPRRTFARPGQHQQVTFSEGMFYPHPSDLYRRTIESPIIRATGILTENEYPANFQGGFSNYSLENVAFHLLQPPARANPSSDDTWHADVSSLLGRAALTADMLGIDDGREIDALLLLYIDCLRRGKPGRGALNVAAGKLALPREGLDFVQRKALLCVADIWNAAAFSTPRVTGASELSGCLQQLNFTDQCAAAMANYTLLVSRMSDRRLAPLNSNEIESLLKEIANKRTPTTEMMPAIHTQMASFARLLHHIQIQPRSEPSIDMLDYINASLRNLLAFDTPVWQMGNQILLVPAINLHHAALASVALTWAILQHMSMLSQLSQSLSTTVLKEQQHLISIGESLGTMASALHQMLLRSVQASNNTVPIISNGRPGSRGRDLTTSADLNLQFLQVACVLEKAISNLNAESMSPGVDDPKRQADELLASVKQFGYIGFVNQFAMAVSMGKHTQHHSHVPQSHHHH